MKLKWLEKRKEKLGNYLEIIKRCFVLLTNIEMRKLFFVGVAQIFLAFLDLVGVLSIGVIGALSVYGIQSRTPTTQVKWVLDFLGIQSWQLQSQVALLGIFAGTVLISKSILSARINRRTIFFLSARSAELSARLVERLTFSNLEQIRKRSRFENIFLLTNGVQSITVGAIGTIVSFFSDISLITIMFFGLLIVDPSIALTTICFFGLIAWILYKRVNRKLIQLVTRDASLQIINNQLLYELFGIYREIFVRGIRNDYVSRIASQRRVSSRVASEIAFLPSVSKYALEIAFVVGSFIFVGIQFLLKDAAGAISTIGVFVASTGRIIPAVLRIQGAAITIRGAIAGAKKTLDVIGELDVLAVHTSSISETKTGLDLVGELEFSNVSFKYSGNSITTLKNLNFRIDAGNWVALVGPSGAGKTTLVDVMLGILKPTEGEVRLSGADPEQTVSSHPGGVAYVPQESFITEGTIKQNIALGTDEKEIDIQRVMECLEAVGLKDLIENSESGVSMEVGELGTRLSGGQRQRIGIARALYTSPKILILDEATSSLDALSESKISDCLNKLRGETTIVSVAHRLSTVTNADKVIYLEQGEVISIGTFDEVRKAVPNFDKQAELLGINRDL